MLNILDKIDNEVQSSHKRTIGLYEINYERLRKDHKQFCERWHSEFMSDHRFLNRVVYCLLKYGIGKEKKIMDIGCYDGVLVKILNDIGFDCYGYEQYPWKEMYNLLEVGDKINVKAPKIDIAIMLNYIQEFKPKGLFKFIEKQCGGIPEIIFFDREERTGMNNECYYDEKILNQYKIQVLKMPFFGDPTDTQRDLLICKS